MTVPVPLTVAPFTAPIAPTVAPTTAPAPKPAAVPIALTCGTNGHNHHSACHQTHYQPSRRNGSCFQSHDSLLGARLSTHANRRPTDIPVFLTACAPDPSADPSRTKPSLDQLGILAFVLLGSWSRPGKYWSTAMARKAQLQACVSILETVTFPWLHPHDVRYCLFCCTPIGSETLSKAVTVHSTAPGFR